MNESSIPTTIPDLLFRETMRGYLCAGHVDFETGYTRGQQLGTTIEIALTILIDDVSKFIDQAEHTARATGYVCASLFGGKRKVEEGEFNLFVDTVGDSYRKRMEYRLVFSDATGARFCLRGYKDCFDDFGPDLWSDTTTLRFSVFRMEGSAEMDRVAAVGMLHIYPWDFLRQLTSFRSYASNASERWSALFRFGQFFLGSLWEVYGLYGLTPGIYPYEREIPLFTTEGVPHAECTVHPIITADKLGLSMFRFLREPSKDVVMIIHGLTTSSDMFIMPEHYNLVTYLLDHKFTDVWTLDYRMSNRLPYNQQRHRFSMDDIALFDYPPALAKIRAEVGPDARIHVISHCLGAVSFTMSLFGKAVSGVRSVVANSAALTPRVPAWSRVKLTFAPFVTEYLLGMAYLDPRFAESPGLTLGKVLGKLTSIFHRECDVPACHMLSMMWGSGNPALYNHCNLADVTHRRGGDLYGPTSVHYYRHVLKMVRHNNTAVKYNTKSRALQSLPNNYFDHVKDVATPVLFMTGQENHVFTDSNIVCHERVNRIVPNRHQLCVIPGYGHQDVFMGKNVHRDVFPHILEFLEKQARPLPLGAGEART